MKCKKCGKKLRRNELFCTVCGYYNDPNQEEKEEKIDNDDFDLTNEDWGSKEEDKKEEKELDKILKENKKKPKEEKKKEEDFEEIDEDERFVKAYIGEDYNIVKNSFFNIWALLFTWIYFLYRKLFITGIIGLVITYIVLVYFNSLLIPYGIAVCLLSGLLFNKYYILIIQSRIKGIHKKYEGSDDNTLEDICGEKGGVNFIYPLIIYFIFLAVVVLSSPSININISKKSNIKFFNENTENKANCNAFLKTAYSNIEETYKDEKVMEATCKIVKNPKKEYILYLKTQNTSTINYFYYKVSNDQIEYKGNTEELVEINKKEQLNKEDEERKKDLINVKTDYSSIYNSSRREDDLISKRQNTSEKLNYVFSRQEVIR